MRFFSSCALALGLLATPATADQATVEQASAEAYVPYTTIKPCDWWSYDSGSGNYVCNYYPTRINIVEASDVERIVNDLETRIADLEARVAELEADKD